MFYGLAICFIFILTIAATTIGSWTNYNSNNTVIPPQIDAYNQHQIDAEACDGGCPPAMYPTFQDWGAALWPYNPATLPYPNANGIRIGPGAAASWTLSAVNWYPEMKWGVYQMSLVLVTHDPMAMTYGPAAPVNINIEVDGVLQVVTTVWSASNINHYSVWTGIFIDFHLNYGQNNQPSWPGQPWTADHFISIINTDPNNILFLDEYHLSTV